MICLIPIFFKDEAERVLLLGAKEFLSELVSDLAAMPCVTVVYIVSNVDSQELGLLSLPKMSFAKMDILPLTPSQERLPLGSKSALDWLLGEKAVLGGSLCCVIDFRNPLLNAAIIGGVFQAAKADPIAVHASAVQPKDHPCQAETPYDISFLALIHVIDQGGEAAQIAEEMLGSRYCVTRPFVFDWEANGAQTGIDLYALRFSFRDGRLVPVYPGSGENEEWLLWRVNEDLARWICPEASLPIPCPLGVCAPGSVMGHQSGVRFIVYAHESDSPGGWCLHFEGLPLGTTGELRLRTMPLCANGPVYEGFNEVIIDGNLLWADIPAPPRDAGALMISILCGTFTDRCDMVLPFVTEGSEWTFDHRYRRRIRRSDSQPITGRQGFPDVFAADGSFFAGTLENLSLIARRRHEPIIKLYPMPNEAHRGENFKLSLMRREIRSRAHNA